MDDAPRRTTLFERIEAELDPIERQMFIDERLRIEGRLPDEDGLELIDVRSSMRDLAVQNALLTIAYTKMQQDEIARVRREANKAKQFRVFRILTYTGSYEWLQRNFSRLGVPLRGSHSFGGGSISSTVVSEIPELIDADEPILDSIEALDAFINNVEPEPRQ